MRKHRLAAGVVLLGIAAFAATAHLAAQAQQRALYVTALDKSGNPVPELQPSDVIVREDDVRRGRFCASRRRPSRCRSRFSSTTAHAAERYIRDYRDALPAFVSALTADTQASEKHQIALIALGERPTILTDYTTDPARVQKGDRSRVLRVGQRRVFPRRHHRGQPGHHQAQRPSSGDRRDRHRGSRPERAPLPAGPRSAAPRRAPRSTS